MKNNVFILANSAKKHDLNVSKWCWKVLSTTIGGGSLGRDKHSQFREMLKLMELHCI